MKTRRKILSVLIALAISCFSLFAITIVPTATAEQTQSNEISLNIEAKNLSYSDSVYIIYAVSQQGFDKNVNTVKMLFWEETQNEYILGTEKYQVESRTLETVNDKTCIVYYSNGLAAKEMTDDIYARAFVEIDGTVYYSDVTKFSVLEYVYQMHEKRALTEKQVNLFDSMLNYGAAAQILFDYNLDRLANETYYKLEVENGTLADGFAYGRYTAEESVTIIANAPATGYEFSGWQDLNGDIISQ